MKLERKPVAYAHVGSALYAYMLAVMCAVVILSGIGAVKGVKFGPVITDGGFFLFPLAYILGDVITEVYGVAAARRAIIMGFIINVISALTYWLIIALPGMGDNYAAVKQEALKETLGLVPVVVLAGLLGFLAGQSVNSLIMWFGKQRRQESGLIARLAGSTGAGELVDTIVFCSIAATAIGIHSVSDWANYTFFGFIYKVLVQFLVMPITAAAIKLIKKREPSYQAALEAAADGPSQQTSSIPTDQSDTADQPGPVSKPVEIIQLAETKSGPATSTAADLDSSAAPDAPAAPKRRTTRNSRTS